MMRGRIFRVSFFLCFFVLIGPAALASNAPVMTVPGIFGVDPSGAANYTIPISAPPGTAGMMPSIALSYSSSSGDGPVGIGWSISGLSAITHCARTIAQDGVRGSLNGDSNDRLCLDGKRLVPVSGSNGAVGTIYRTEIDSFSKIAFYKPSGSVYGYFKVWAKSGTVLEFGNSNSSHSAGWLLNKITDAKGNYLTITYVNGEPFPDRIDYTGNANVGLATNNSIRFTYVPRSDKTASHFNYDRRMTNIPTANVLLSHVQAYQGNTLVYDYQLTYRAGSGAVRSRLTQVALCDGGSPQKCLAPTTFDWQGGSGALSYTTGTAPGADKNQVGDLDGDGNADYLGGLGSWTNLAGLPQGPYATTMAVYFGSNAGAFTQASRSVQTYAPVPGTLCSFPIPTLIGVFKNSQGIASLYFSGATQRYVYHQGCYATQVPWIFSNDGSGNHTNAQNAGGLMDSPTPASALADWNGDGASEWLDGVSGTAPLTGDFSGSGCAGALSVGAGRFSIRYYGCAMSQTTVNYTGGPGGAAVGIVGDFDGDGRDEILSIPSSGAGSMYFLNASSYPATSVPLPAYWDSGYKFAVGDFNGDGRSDLALIPTAGGSAQIFLATGNGFSSSADLTIPNISAGAAGAAWDVNGDGAEDLVIGTTSYIFSYTPEKIITVHNGIGATTSVAYNRLNANGSFYQKCANGTYNCGDASPTQAVDNATYVVSQTSASNGIGGARNTTYSYMGLKKDTSGRGLLGFSRITATDQQSGFVTTTHYLTAYPYTGLVSSQTVVGCGGVMLKSINNQHVDDTSAGVGTDGVQRHFVKHTQSTLAQNDCNGSTLPSTTTSYTYDSYGNALTVNTSLSDGSSKNTTNTYSNDTTNWFLGRLTYTSVASAVGSSNITRTSCFQYDAYGLLTREVIEPVSSSNCTYSATGVQTDYTYDSFGHRITSTVNGSGIATRSSSAGYDALGQFQTSATNALSQSESWVYDARFGLPTSHTGPNGLTTSWSYDGFGRVLTETAPDGNYLWHRYRDMGASATGYVFEHGMIPYNAAGGQNGAASYVYSDCLGRSVLTEQQYDLDHYDWSDIWTEYDGNGRVYRVSKPTFHYASGAPSRWFTYSYDVLDRVTQVAHPDGRIDTTSYSGLTTTVAVDTGGKNQTTTTVKNAQGLVASVTDALNHTTTYTYDAVGNLKTVTDPFGNVITNTYNTRGFKTASSDPDMGSWSYAYDVLGQLTSQTDAKSQTTTLAYDVLGRVTSRSESGLYSTWTYGTSSSSHNVGKLVEAKACTSSGCSTVVANRTFTYDGLGRPSTMALAAGGATHTYTDTYDSNGRLNTVAYPSGFTAQYTYTALGYLSQIKDNATGSAYWTANTRDAEMHLLSQTFGNGVSQTNSFDANTGFLTNVRAGTNNMVANFDYTYDTLGNLTYRADGYAGTFEYACYDSLNRLTQYAVGNGVTACTSSQNNKVVAYDALGNITSKTGVGTYGYASAGSARPHAVSSVNGTVNGVVNPSYTYDANGNMTAGAGRSVTYTSFNMTASIQQGSTTVAFTYDSEHTRVQMTAPSGATTYINDTGSGAMSEKLVSGSATTWHDYLMADGKIVAEKFSGGTTAVRYFVSDHLGSVAVVMNEAGAVVERNAYDAWGKRRNIDGSDDTTCLLTSQTTRGYTGHEQIDAQCLINANARIYDPAIGKFMSADSVIPEPFDLQSYNRYTYVNNRPLSATDPTGHDSVGVWADKEHLYAQQEYQAQVMNLFLACGITTSPSDFREATTNIYNKVSLLQLYSIMSAAAAESAIGATRVLSVSYSHMDAEGTVSSKVMSLAVTNSSPNTMYVQDLGPYDTDTASGLQYASNWVTAPTKRYADKDGTYLNGGMILPDKNKVEVRVPAKKGEHYTLVVGVRGAIANEADGDEGVGMIAPTAIRWKAEQLGYRSERRFDLDVGRALVGGWRFPGRTQIGNFERFRSDDWQGNGTIVFTFHRGTQVDGTIAIVVLGR